MCCSGEKVVVRRKLFNKQRGSGDLFYFAKAGALSARSRRAPPRLCSRQTTRSVESIDGKKWPTICHQKCVTLTGLCVVTTVAEKKINDWQSNFSATQFEQKRFLFVFN
jgi:hypothetical protein